MSIESVMLSNHLTLCHPLLLLPSVLPSIRIFPNESVLPIRWPKYWSFSFSISLSNEYSGLISFRIDWFDLLAVQGMLKSLLQNYSLKALNLQSSGDSLEKTWMLGKTEGKRRRGWQRMRGLGCITNSMNMNLSKLWDIVENRGAWLAAVHGVAKSQLSD